MIYAKLDVDSKMDSSKVYLTSVVEGEDLRETVERLMVKRQLELLDKMEKNDRDRERIRLSYTNIDLAYRHIEILEKELDKREEDVQRQEREHREECEKRERRLDEWEAEIVEREQRLSQKEERLDTNMRTFGDTVIAVSEQFTARDQELTAKQLSVDAKPFEPKFPIKSTKTSMMRTDAGLAHRIHIPHTAKMTIKIPLPPRLPSYSHVIASGVMVVPSTLLVNGHPYSERYSSMALCNRIASSPQNVAFAAT